MLRAFFYGKDTLMKKESSVKKMVLLAMLCAVSFLAVSLIRIPVVLFLSYEPKDVVITIGGFLLGPLAGFIVSLVVSLLEMFTISTTGPIGAVMNLLSTCAFACTASFIYKKKHTLTGAVLGLLCGSVLMIAAMLLWNYLITPLYMTGTSRDDVAAMLIPIFLPFNALKAGLNTAFTLALYKPLVSALRKTGLIPKSATPAENKVGAYILAGILLVTCILLLLVYRGIL
jgi:riboflavin transporter FmnP